MRFRLYRWLAMPLLVLALARSVAGEEVGGFLARSYSNFMDLLEPGKYEVTPLPNYVPKTLRLYANYTQATLLEGFYKDGVFYISKDDLDLLMGRVGYPLDEDTVQYRWYDGICTLTLAGGEGTYDAPDQALP